MKPLNIVIAVILIAAIAAGAWYFMQPAAPAEKVAEAPKAEAPTPVAAPTPPPPAVKPAPAPTPVPAPVAKPTMAPVVSMSTPAPKPAQAAPAPTADPTGNPQADLSTALPDIARLFRAGDFATLAKTYMTPDKYASMTPQQQQQLAMMAQMAQAPEAKPMFDAMAQSMEDLQNQTPTYNDAKDEATYQMSPPAGMAPPNTPPQPVTFIKISGQWYIKDGPGGGF